MAAQTIEQTAKKYKLQIVLSSLVIVLGLALLIVTAASNLGNFGFYVTALSVVIMLSGIIWLAIVKFLTWWHHG